MQFVMETLKINEAGNLALGGCDLSELAKEYGTPFYAMDEDAIRANCRVYRQAVDTYYGGRGLVLYASKALSCKAIYRIMQEEGLGVDVVSGGELYTALQAGFPADKIYFHGNNKTAEELTMALENGVGRIVVDNAYELEMLDTLAGQMEKTVHVLFRIKPGIDAHTHSFIRTGQIDSKFGVALENGEAEALIKLAHEMPHIRIEGIHCHMGSQIFELAPFELAAEKMMHFIGDLHDRYGSEIAELNLGGGFGIKYVSQDQPVDYHRYMEAVSEVVKSTAAERGVKQPFILMEPGRSIVAPAGLTVYTVGNIKEIKGVRTYVSVDGGMGDNPRYILYAAEYEAVPVHDPLRSATKVVTVAGKCCESGDILLRDAKLPALKPGELLAVLATGAYNYSMASNYNRIPRPPVLLLKDGAARVAVRRETYEDLVRNDV